MPRPRTAIFAGAAIALVAGLLLLAAQRWPSRPEPGASHGGASPRDVAAAAARAPVAASTAAAALPAVRDRRGADDARCRLREADASHPGSGDGASGVPAAAWWAPAREELLQRLRNSPDAYANAVATWLEVADDDPDRRAARESRLAALATATQDPRVYALAMRTCWHHESPACQTLSPRRWSELDPDNAMPWLMMMDDAMSRRDLSGVQEAMFRATQARGLAEREQAPVQAIVDAATDDPDSLLAARALVLFARGMVAAQPGPIVAMQACRRVTPADANAWQQCAAMMDLLEHRSDSLLARSLGAQIDMHRTGGDRAMRQVAAWRERETAIDWPRSAGCADLRDGLAFIRRVAVEGEVAALQARGE